jgi:hypothetical protein
LLFHLSWRFLPGGWNASRFFVHGGRPHNEPLSTHLRTRRAEGHLEVAPGDRPVLYRSGDLTGHQGYVHPGRASQSDEVSGAGPKGVSATIALLAFGRILRGRRAVDKNW